MFPWLKKITLNHVFEGTLNGPERDDESMCLEMRSGLQDRGDPLQRDGVHQGWNPPRRGVLPLDPTQEAGGRVLYGGGGFQRIEETSHSPWIATPVQ